MEIAKYPLLRMSTKRKLMFMADKDGLSQVHCVHHANYGIGQHQSSSDIYHRILFNSSCVSNKFPCVDLAYYD